MRHLVHRLIHVGVAALLGHTAPLAAQEPARPTGAEDSVRAAEAARGQAVAMQQTPLQ